MPTRTESTGAGELISLLDAGIVSLNLANTLKNPRTLANGNQLTREGSFTRTDGTTSAMGEFNLATDTFNTKFAEQIEVSEALKALPNMQGAGNVRELQQAAAQSDTVAGLLAQFQGAATRAEQKALIDQLITAWADTSGMAKSLDARAQGHYIIQYEAFGNDRRADHIDSAGFIVAQTAGPLTFEGMTGALSTDIGASYLSAHYRELIDSWNQKLHALEAFNGQYFFNLPTQKSQTSNANWGMTVTTTPGSTQNSGGICHDLQRADPETQFLDGATRSAATGLRQPERKRLCQPGDANATENRTSTRSNSSSTTTVSGWMLRH